MAVQQMRECDRAVQGMCGHGWFEPIERPGCQCCGERRADVALRSWDGTGTRRARLCDECGRAMGFERVDE